MRPQPTTGRLLARVNRKPALARARGRHNGQVDVVSLGFRTDVAIRLAEGGQVIDCGDHIVIRSPDNPGYRWGNFVLLASPPRLGDLDGWQARFAGLFPDATYQAFGVDVTDGPAACQDVFTEAGFETERSVVLTATGLSGAPRHEAGRAVRPLAGEDDWRQSAELWAACADPGEAGAAPAAYQEFATRRLAANRRLTETGRGTWFGAFAAGRLVAQLGLVRVGGGDARYQDVETHPAFRRRGLAGRLICLAGRQALADPEVSRLVIVADPGYHAVRLYESLGFRPVEDQLGYVRTA